MHVVQNRAAVLDDITNRDLERSVFDFTHAA